MQGLTSCSSTTSRVVTLQELVGWMTSRLKLRTRTSSTGQELQENVGVDTSTRAWEYIRVHRGKAGVSSDSQEVNWYLKFTGAGWLVGALSRQTKDWIKFTRLWCHLLVSSGLVAVGWQVLKDTLTTIIPTDPEI